MQIECDYKWMLWGINADRTSLNTLLSVQLLEEFDVLTKLVAFLNIFYSYGTGTFAP